MWVSLRMRVSYCRLTRLVLRIERISNGKGHRPLDELVGNPGWQLVRKKLESSWQLVGWVGN